jgi:glutamate/tyrosine decarboxylase-like PLP-dependent enzyme
MDPIESVDETSFLLEIIHNAAITHLSELQNLPVRSIWPEDLEAKFSDHLPEYGLGSFKVIESLVDSSLIAATRSTGPRFYNFVSGGVTPAALAADWLVSLLDQNVAGKLSSEYGTLVEISTIQWLLELFELPKNWSGALVGSATFANFTGLSCARQWWGEQLGFNPASEGITEKECMLVVSSGYVHPSVRKALQMLGHGSNTVKVFSLDDVGRIDFLEMRSYLKRNKKPSVIVANAGEVNAGDFDPIANLAELAEETGSWLHVDAAFGLFALLSDTASDLLQGIELADSIAADAHKWLNVPYESGFCLVKNPSLLGRSFGMPSAPYIQDLSKPDGGFATLGPEASRRARAIPIWATLAAYGKKGYQLMINRHIKLAKTLANLIDMEPDFEVLAEVKVPIVCFRYCLAGATNEDLNLINEALVSRIVNDRRFAIGITQYASCTALRAALFNWRITENEITEFFELLKNLARN